MRPSQTISITALTLFIASTVSAGVPATKNAKVTTQSAAAGLDAAFLRLLEAQSEPGWVGYEVPSIPGSRMYCGHSPSHDCMCRLESRHQSYSQSSGDDSDETPEPGQMLVLLRLEDHRVERIRTFSSYCGLDAGGLPFFWLDDVRPSESVALLESIVGSASTGIKHTHDAVDEAITAIAFHADPSAQLALEKLLGPDQPEEIRKQAVFWVGQNSGSRGAEILRRVLSDDHDRDVREAAVFALSCSKAPEAIDVLINTARKDENPKIRSNALFWLANKAGDKSAETIADAAKNDPDADVKEQAIFALTQLPTDKGVPLLIDVARTNRSAKVREQAIFWLGQSGDPRALDFFEEVLSH